MTAGSQQRALLLMVHAAADGAGAGAGVAAGTFQGIAAATGGGRAPPCASSMWLAVLYVTARRATASEVPAALPGATHQDSFAAPHRWTVLGRCYFYRQILAPTCD